MAQENNHNKLPFNQIGDYPENYSPVSILFRLIQGVGFRYYWATDKLTSVDLYFKPDLSAKSTFQTLEHLYNLSETVKNTVYDKPNYRPYENKTMTYLDLREKTLFNLKEANDYLIGKDDCFIKNMKIIFERNGDKTFFPFWNLLNGPISDMIYHTGQIVSFRRTTGNPIQSGVNVFTGKTLEIY
jgi:hypothetical protein